MSANSDDVAEMVNTCIAHKGILNSWEENFIDDMEVRIDKNYKISEKQEEIIKRIFMKIQRRKL